MRKPAAATILAQGKSYKTNVRKAFHSIFHIGHNKLDEQNV